MHHEATITQSKNWYVQLTFSKLRQNKGYCQGWLKKNDNKRDITVPLTVQMMADERLDKPMDEDTCRWKNGCLLV